MKHLKLFEDFNDDRETLIDLFLDIKDKYSLNEIEGDPFHGRGSMFFRKSAPMPHGEYFPVGNSFYVRQSPNLLKEAEENGYLSIVILLTIDSVDIYADRTAPDRFKAPPTEKILQETYPEFLNDIEGYKKSVDSFVRMLGYRSEPSKLISFRQCQDFGVIEAIFNFTILEYKKKQHTETENFLKRVYNYDIASRDKEMVAKLKKMGYNI